MPDQPDWLTQVISRLAEKPLERTPEEMAQHIHQALEIAEVKKYATPDSRFTFTFTNASDEDLARIRRCLTPFENLIVEIKRN